MESIHSFFQGLYNSPHYSFGWIVMALLAVVPAIVSGNMLLHHLSILNQGQLSRKESAKAVLINLVILAVCIAIMAYAFYVYVWM